MRRGAAVIILCIAAGCRSSQTANDEPSTVPPPQPASSTSPTVDAQLANLQTSLTELLDRLDVLNARITRLESGAPLPSAGPPTAPPGAAAPHSPPRAAALHTADIAESYRRAIVLIGQAKYAEARAAFQKVFDAEPAGQLADNALFWIGETYFAAGDYPNAMRYYERVTKEFAEENKAPDAMFKLGVAYAKSGDLAMARRAFDECIAKYPYSSSAAAAKVELKRIKY